MQKFYILLSLMFLTFSSQAAEQTKPTWDVIQFKPSEWANGKRTLSIGDDYKVNVTLFRHQFETLPVSCIVLDKEYATFDFVSLYDDASLNVTNANNRDYSAHISFEPVGDFRITKIDYIGHARTSEPSSLIVGVSISDTIWSTGRPPKDDFNTSYTGGTSRRVLDFNPAYTGAEICDVVTAEIAPGDEDFQSKVTYIRMNWSNANFAGAKVDRGSPLDLFGFRIYTDIIPTGIGEESADTYSMTQRGGILEFTEESAIEIYSLSGKLVDKVQGSNVSIDTLEKGVYIVKAVSLESNTRLVKKIMR